VFEQSDSEKDELFRKVSKYKKRSKMLEHNQEATQLRMALLRWRFATLWTCNEEGKIQEVLSGPEIRRLRAEIEEKD